MSERVRLRIAVDDIKKTYNDYVSGRITLSQLARLVEPNVRLVMKLVENAYPKEVYDRLEKKMIFSATGEDIFTFISYSKDSNPYYGHPATKSAMEHGLSELIASMEALFSERVPTENEMEELDYKMNRLTEQFSMGQISEEAYKVAMRRLQERTDKLKARARATLSRRKRMANH
jgi:hypothetical protein